MAGHPHPNHIYVQYVILSEAAVALCQSQMNLLLERCCMGVVYQITDLDNSSGGASERRRRDCINAAQQPP